MSWFLTLLVASLTAPLGLLCGGLVMNECVKWHNVSSFEGKAGFAVVGVALVGAAAGFATGLVAGRVVAAQEDPEFLHALGLSNGLVLGMAALAAALGWWTREVDTASTPRADLHRESHEGERLAAAQVEQASFDAVPPDAPVSAWLAFVRVGATEERWADVVRRITAKAGWASELASQVLSEDARNAEAALRAVGRLERPPADLVPAVAAAARRIAADLRRANAASVAEDPQFLRAADVSIRFSGWIAAARALRERAAGDFVPELLELLALSRERSDCEVLTRDVRRVASYYAKAWGGIEPQPGDPKPR